MGLFGSRKKNDAPIRTLSEKEIQSRLYGHLREPGPAQEDLPQLSKPKPQDSFQKTSSVSTKTLTPSAAPAHQKPTIASPELFGETEAPETEAPRHYSEPPKKREPSFNNRTEFSSPKPAVKPEKKASSFSGAAVQKNIGKGFQATGNIAKTAGLKIAGVVALILTSIIRAVSSIDFRKPGVRRAVYTGLGIGTLALIFFGVHLLNAQREAAMKNPPKQTLAPKAVKAAPVAETVTPAAPVQEKKAETKTLKPAAEVKTETPKKPAQPKITETPAAEKTAETAPVETPVKAAVPAQKIDGPAYVIQVATFADQADAEKLAERFKADSLNAFIKPLSRSGGRVYYCVFIGKFKTGQDAETALAGFKKKTIAQPFQDAFIRLMQ